MQGKSMCYLTNHINVLGYIISFNFHVSKYSCLMISHSYLVITSKKRYSYTVIMDPRYSDNLHIKYNYCVSITQYNASHAHFIMKYIHVF